MNNYKSNLSKLYMYYFFSYFMVYLPYIVYYFQYIGFNLTKIATLFAIKSVTQIILEIPTGYIADKIGKVKTLILSLILEIIGLGIILYSVNYNAIIISHILLGAGFALFSGADSALVYETLKKEKKEKDYKTIYGRCNGIGEISIIFATILGSLIILEGLKLTIIISIISLIIGTIITITIKEPYVIKKNKIKIKKEIINLYEIVKQSLHNSKIRAIFIYSFFIMGLSNIVYTYYQPYFNATNVPLFYYGIIFALFSIITAIVNFNIQYIENKLGVYRTLIMMPILIGLSFFFSGYFFIQIGFLFFIFREIVRGISIPVLTDYTNQLIKDETKRATILSVGGMFSRLGFAIMAVCIGFFADKNGLSLTFIIIGIVILLFSFMFTKILKKSKNFSYG
jgi:MFS family permease